MSETLTLDETASHDILILAAAALSAAPNLTDAERAARRQTVIRGTMAFRPADPAQTLLATLILGHHLTVMDGFRDIARQTLSAAEASHARSVTVSQTKLLLQIVRELRLAREAAQTRTAPDQPAAEPGEPAPAHAGDPGQEASLARFMAACAETLATLGTAETLTPAAAGRARDALSQAMPPSLFAVPQDPGREPKPAAVPARPGRAQRRAMMKRQGAFKRTA